MHYKSAKFIALALCSTILMSCKTDISVETYASDVFLDENAETPAVVKVEITSCEKQGEYGGKILALFNENSAAKIVGCEKDGIRSMLVIGLTAELASQTSSYDLVLFRDLSQEDQEQDGQRYGIRGVAPTLSQNFLTRLNAFMKQNHQTLSYSDVVIDLTLFNDTKEDLLMSTAFVWVDGQPYQSYNKQPLEKRRKVTVTLSNVVSDMVLKGQQPKAFYVLKALGAVEAPVAEAAPAAPVAPVAPAAPVALEAPDAPAADAPSEQPAAVAAAQAPPSTPAADPAAVVAPAVEASAGPGSLTAPDTVFAPNAAIQIGYAGLPSAGQNWIGLALPSDAPGTFYQLQMLPPGQTDGVAVFEGLPENAYEARLFANWPDGGYEIHGRVPLEVRAQ